MPSMNRLSLLACVVTLLCLLHSLYRHRNHAIFTNNSHSTNVVVVVIASNDSLNDDVIYSIEEKKNYAHKHGYQFEYSPQLDYSRKPGWSKMMKVKELIPYHSNAWFWVVDTDTVITNDNVRVLDFVPGGDVPQVIIGKDCNALNSGSILMRSGKWNSWFIERIFSVSNEDLTAEVSWAENSAVIHLYKTDSRVRRRMWIAPAYWFNAYVHSENCKGGSGNPWRPWRKNDFLVHFAGQPNKEKSKLMRQYRLLKSQNQSGSVGYKEVQAWWDS